VIMLNAPGITFPQVSFELAVDSRNEPTAFNHLTPLGQRQQYLIGNELRQRYTEFGGLLLSDYNVNQTKMRTPFIGRNILSMQAQMMGFFPEGTENDLTEWQ